MSTRTFTEGETTLVFDDDTGATRWKPDRACDVATGPCIVVYDKNRMFLGELHKCATHSSLSGQVLLDTLFDDNRPPLSEYKDLRKADVDIQTKKLILSGYNHNGKTFSTSETAQRSWESRNNNRNGLTYPYEVSTIDDQKYNVVDADEINTIYLGGLGQINGYLAIGRNRKELIDAAIDYAAVDAVIASFT